MAVEKSDSILILEPLYDINFSSLEAYRRLFALIVMNFGDDVP